WLYCGGRRLLVQRRRGFPRDQIVGNHKSDQDGGRNGIQIAVRGGSLTFRVPQHLGRLRLRRGHAIVVGHRLLRVDAKVFRIGPNKSPVKDSSRQQLEVLILDCDKKAGADSSFGGDLFQRNSGGLSCFLKGSAQIRHSEVSAVRKLSKIIWKPVSCR